MRTRRLYMVELSVHHFIAMAVIFESIFIANTDWLPLNIEISSLALRWHFLIIHSVVNKITRLVTLGILLLPLDLLCLDRSCILRLVRRCGYLAEYARAAADVRIVVRQVNILRLLFLRISLRDEAALAAVSITGCDLRLRRMCPDVAICVHYCLIEFKSNF